MNRPRRDQVAVALASLFLTAGFLFNPWFFGGAPFYRVDIRMELVVWGMFDLLALFFALWLLRHRTSTWWKPRIFARALLLLLITLGVQESAIRFLESRRVIAYRHVKETSPLLGWQAKGNLHHVDRSVPELAVPFTSNADGFRSFGNTASPRVKVLVLGDSFTHSLQVPDGMCYFHLLQERGAVEVFAYGCGGYGTIQEYLVLDRFLDRIRPDLILWQFHPNDFVNNLYDLESRSLHNNSHALRPYWQEGRIQYRRPHSISHVFGSLENVSGLLRYFSLRIDRLWVGWNGTIEGKLTPDHPLLIRSLAVTSEILGLVRARAGEIPIAAFSASDAPPLEEGLFRDLCKRHSIHYIPGVLEALRRAREQGITVQVSPDDGHWNPVGHRVAAEAILDFLQSHDLLRKRD